MVIVKVFKNIKDMTGIGEEWLLNANGDIVAVFVNGFFRSETPVHGDLERTKVA